MHYLSKEMLDCKPPSRVYTLFLQEKWFEYQLGRLKEQLNPSLDTPQELIETLQHYLEEEKDQLSEFYLHNLVTPGPYKWSPNTYVGDFQLRAMTSWMRHEIMRDEENKVYLESEKVNELWIRKESTNPTEVIYWHKILTSDKDMFPILMTKQQEALDKLDEVIPQMKSHSMEACFERWKELIAYLKSREPHSPFALNNTLFRASMCKEVIKNLKLEWIGQRLAPPLLLWVQNKALVRKRKEEN